ncbi:MAG: hypothetical protein IPH93_06830 [Saprospiraceae bacterium]|nr:hypothetical protein [Saprospiraceae bacterium]
MKSFWILLIISLSFQIHGWSQSIWPILSQVKYKKIQDEQLGFEVDYPIFGSELRSLDGKWVQVKGYIIPTDGYKSHTEFVFSAFPYKSCYFCGGAGPETVMEIQAHQGIQFTSEKIELKGRLKLNDSDLNRLMFILTDAEILK